VLPEARVVRDLPPAFTNASNPAYLAMGEIAEDVKQDLVRQLLYRLYGRDVIM